MATAQTLRRVRPDDREPLGGNRRVHQLRRESLSPVCGRVKQQDSCHPASGLWVKGSRILTPQGPHLHVIGTVSLKSCPLDWEKTLKIKGERTEVNICGKRIEADNYDTTLKKIARKYVAKRRKEFKKIKKRWRSFQCPSIEELMRSIKHDKNLGLFKNVNTENEINEKALQLRNQIEQNLKNQSKLIEEKAERDFVGNEEEHLKELKSQIHPGDLLIFIKGKIFCSNAFADLSEGFKAPDNSAIYFGLFSDPDIEIGENFVGSR